MWHTASAPDPMHPTLNWGSQDYGVRNISRFDKNAESMVNEGSARKEGRYDICFLFDSERRRVNDIGLTMVLSY